MTGQTATALVAADRSFNRVRFHIPCLHISLIVRYCVSAAASCLPAPRDHVLAMDPGISALVLLCSALLGAGSGAGAECGGGDCSTLTRHTLHHWLGRGSRNNNNVRSLYTVHVFISPTRQLGDGRSNIYSHYRASGTNISDI